MTQPDTALVARLRSIVTGDPDLMALLHAVRDLGLPDWRLASGALYQTVWNHLGGHPRGTGIKDYDIVYFDDTDLSWEAEDRAIRRVAAATAGGIGPIEVRNQARVHLWFPERFGLTVPPLGSTDESLLRYAATTHAVAVRLEADGSLDVARPFGLADIFDRVLRPNTALDNKATYDAKAARMKAIWPEVTVLPWP